METKNKIFIPYNVPSSKNSRRIKILRDPKGNLLYDKYNNPRCTLSYSIPTTHYIKKSRRYYKSLREQFWYLCRGKPYPIKIELLFVRKNNTKWDFNNMTHIIMDLMKKEKWIPDDDVTRILPYPPLEEPYYKIDKNNPGVIIKIL